MLEVLRLPRGLQDGVAKVVLPMVAAQCVNLEEVALPCAANLSLLQQCPKLRSVALRKCDKELAANNFRSFTKLAAMRERLEVLSLSELKSSASGKAILAAVVHLEKLKSLTLINYSEFFNMKVRPAGKLVASKTSSQQKGGTGTSF